MASSPAEAYAAAKSRVARPRLTEFVAGLSFELDGFQRAACDALEDGHGVLVCAPTGAGKTVVGEFAVHLALAQGLKCFYTTPIKALSNQKYADLVARHGESAVGLLTGDTSVNGDAQVVVMTTEVLRNMIYAGSRHLDQLGYVVMDEVHYLADRFRGAVWEEVILQLPEHVALVSLSATVSNAEEFGDWLVTVRGDTTVVVDEHRPVPLWQHMMVGNRLLDLFVQSGAADDPTAAELRVDPDLVRQTRELDRQSSTAVWDRGRRGRQGSAPRRVGFRPPSRVTVIDRLDRDGLLPAITFVFSRNGCDAAVGQCVRSGLRLTTDDEVAEIRRIVEKHTGDLPQGDLGVLGYWEWREGLERGIAAHHAGLLPAFKETVEELFVRGLVRCVFATETLALGINMPARTVVLERLVKYNGEAHVELTPGEYTQLTGRAGRRGIDVEGHAVVVWQPGVDPERVGGLASTRTYPLRSSFRPGYNMAVNLLARLGAQRSRELLEMSFGQFQADRSVVGMARRIERNEETLAGYASSMECHLGDFAEYAALRRKVSDREKALSRQGVADRRTAAAESLRALRPGDVIAVPGGKRSGLAVVIDPGVDDDGDVRPLVVSEDRWSGRLSAADFPTPVEALGRVKLPRHVDHRSPRGRRDLASSLRNTGIQAPPPQRRRGRGNAHDDPELATLRRALRAHPCHGCADREAHARWGERYHRLDRDTEQLRQKVRATTHSLARQFDRIRALLDERGYVRADADGENAVTEHGERLARLWGESDLLAAECLRHGVWERLTAPELAAVVSALVYESRRDNGPVPRVPAGAVSEALADTVRLWADLESDERRHRIDRTREPDLGFAWPVHRWARGESLAQVLAAAEQNGHELSAGDFVRWCRQVLDLLDQIAGVVGRSTSFGRVAVEAAAAVRRGVVAAGVA
ncbi:DEAD/DEAH box helicase domain protein [Pseudonocardia dioxanivorans CB1190]|uniref:DEAD/DEAH box helicase domain protein n=1 Tax=Pseudonocardia dioxanivorans (strain ATCC 55486 / DSM 44775 / JCM 13855 / CB1190) TaxID=675635 RepID=F4CVZ0_PSEUX|nr:DEAD/DEAH box helicase [Pseudonocardia dioxanivorans]AEA25475.1 DEAD/DEAH box helicase domain protein [Pseudonocardia dioxanivorans CB1190]GJF04390.1 ATP-dependent RNA helicase [Pseudonocardia sp. D17]